MAVASGPAGPVFGRSFLELRMRRSIASRYCAIKSDSYCKFAGPLDQSTSS